MKEKKNDTGKKNAVLESFRQVREKGSISNRFFAMLVDFIIIGFLYQFAVVLLGAPDIRIYMEMQDVVQGLAKDAPEVIARMKLYQQCFIAFLGIGAAYEALFLVLLRGSLGKLLFGFRVASYNEERSTVLCKLMLVLRAAVKALSIYLLSAIPFILLCLTTFSNPEARSGFDMFAGTKLLYKRRSNR